ncbi:MAG: FAD-binding oxidoreductase [Bacteroidota bacterium]|nr:FAD-binding oxidoreductase [Candidatus Kapabacteria bacterium]MDW8219888.1 FAD-binding oxidoreductase [Bacteroidota bacterium]
MHSYWEHSAWLSYDIIVIGAGIIGLSTAIALKEHATHCSVAVLERGVLPSGASTRNAGFACFGSITELLHDMALHGEEQTIQLVRERYEGLRLLRRRLGDNACGYEQYGGAELLFEHNLDALSAIDRVNAALRDVFSANPFYECSRKITQYGLNAERVRALVCNDFEGQLHSGMMMHSLVRYAQERGVMVIWGADVYALDEGAHEVAVHVRQGTPMQSEETSSITFRAAQVALCTNAWIREIVPQVSITPARGQVLITEPLKELPFRGVFHFDEGFYYFRTVSSPEGQRVLLGGGRNRALEQETTTRMELNPAIHQELEHILRTIILPHHTNVQIAERWAGIMGFHHTKLPIVQRVSNRLTVGFGCNGMGVALGSIIGERTARVLLDKAS